jgi:fatty acid/phospholipid biosynthesis enzyme
MTENPTRPAPWPWQEQHVAGDRRGATGSQAAVSAGNGRTHGHVAFVLKTLPGISKAAIAAIWPTLKGESVVLDGATIGADLRN